MYRQVHAEMWREDWFERWSSAAKLVFLCLLTGSDIRPCGFVVETTRRLAFVTSLSLEAVETAARELAPKVHWWPEYSSFWIVRFWRWQGAGPKWARAVELDVARLPAYARAAWDAEYPTDTLSIGHTGQAVQDFQDFQDTKEQEQYRNSTVQDSTLVPLPSPRSETAVSSPAKRGRPKKEFVPLGDDFEVRMLARFPILGAILIHDQIELALSHSARLKYSNMEHYVQNWLRQEADRAQGNGNRFDGPTRGGVGPRWPSAAHTPRSEYEREAADELRAREQRTLP